MKLLWWLVGTPIGWLFDRVPDAPADVSLALPWPSFLPSGPVLAGFAMVMLAAVAFLILKFLRWVYSLVPVVQ